MRTPAGSVVTVTGDLLAACLTVTIEAPPALPGAAATFRTAAETPPRVSDTDRKQCYLRGHANSPGALAAAANGLPGMEAVGEGTNVIAWLAGVTAAGAGLLGEPTPGVAEGTGLEAGEAAGVAGMSYFCSCSR